MKIIARSCIRQNMMDHAGSHLNAPHSKIISISGLDGYIYCSGHIVQEMLISSETSKEAFIQWFQAEVQEASHYEGWFVFNYLLWEVNYIFRD
jgi:hypothetical protein